MMSNLKVCKYYNTCIDNSMVFANNGDYTKAIATFIQDTSKCSCTKIISDNRMSSVVLHFSCSDSKTFRKALSEFYVSCINTH